MRSNRHATKSVGHAAMDAPRSAAGYIPLYTVVFWWAADRHVMRPRGRSPRVVRRISDNGRAEGRNRRTVARAFARFTPTFVVACRPTLIRSQDACRPGAGTPRRRHGWSRALRPATTLPPTITFGTAEAVPYARQPRVAATRVQSRACMRP